MENFDKKIFRYLLFTGILFTLVGIFGIFTPTTFSVYIVDILAAFFFVSGIKNFIKGFQFRKVPHFHWGLYIFIGVLEIVISISLFSQPFLSQLYMIIYAGIFMVFKGIFIFINTIFNRKTFPDSVKFSLNPGITDILFGILLVALPFISQRFITLCVAWYILFSGANLILSAFYFKRS
ncbi:MAG: HdeD family acid-resistance protein [Cetobacterium sp.]|uniref:HdeD family acid-resistance protein n=1 Tax=Cetobacterium sp. TaxID=2071632 RepID=UPI003F327821